ncbi:aminopeptidase N-like [Diadema antillarum]|uniref:aminopeptidase N-like n=1 Tax=Diadema antillarum TaxID=105358 RepID=UPI003A892D21
MCAALFKSLFVYTLQQELLCRSFFVQSTAYRTRVWTVTDYQSERLESVRTLWSFIYLRLWNAREMDSGRASENLIEGAYEPAVRYTPGEDRVKSADGEYYARLSFAGSAAQTTENSMGMDGKFEIDDETGHKRGSGYFCTYGQIGFLVIIACGLIAGVGCMAYYLPERPCIEEGGPATEPGKQTEPPYTEKPPTTKKQTEKPPTEAPTEPGMQTTMAPTSGTWNGRLPENLIPEHYELYLKPYLYEEHLGNGSRLFTFDGEVTIVMRCEMPTDVITLHIYNITVERWELTDKTTGRVINITGWDETLEYQFIHFHVSEMLEEDHDYVLWIKYVGELSDSLAGFYRTSWAGPDGETMWAATSQMQPTDARRALPCFDEPALRAYFDTTIEHRTDMVALSNGIEEEEIQLGNGWMTTSYRTTPKMSTYLLAFVVGYFNYTQAYTENGVRYRVWSRPDAVESTRYALDIGANITTYFEEYFNIPFPLPKQDMIAVPDFSAGAMENWGLIIYRETALLYDERVNSASNKQRVAVVVSHELAHQWFGNLVTPKWWDDLWLNEGFASYVEYLGVDFVEPTWDMREQFVVEDLQRVFDLDSLNTSHPVRVPVNSPAEINEIFDSISYSKGASIIRMLNNFLTEDVFVDGLNYYLTVHSEDNADSDDLWYALTRADEDVGGNNVKQIMDTWTLQMGYPVVTLHRLDRNTVNATQEHFLVDPTAVPDDTYENLGYLWYIYLTMTHATEKEFAFPQGAWLNGERWGVFNLEDTIAENDWFVANIRQFGYFRVNYDDENWARLSSLLQSTHEVLPRENRAALINDAFSLADVGRLSYPIALNITLYLDNELDYIPWEAALGSLAYIRDMFSRYSGYGPLERYMREQINELYVTLGWNETADDPHLQQYNRINAVGTACRYRNEDCLAEASRLYALYMQNSAGAEPNQPDYEINPITPNLKTTVYCYGIQEGGQEEWDFGWNKYLDTTDAAEKSKWLYALSCSQAPWVLSRYMDYSLDPLLVRKQDASYVVRYVSDNYVGRSLAWDFLRNEWDTIYEYYGGGSFSFSNIIADVTEDFNTELELQELIEFGEGRDFGSAARTYQQAIGTCTANINWMNNNAETVANWLEAAAPPISE